MSSQVRERVSRVTLRRPRLASRPFGLSAAEILAAVSALALFALAVVYYFTSLKPEQDRLRALEARYNSELSMLTGVASAGGSGEQPVDTAKEALSSLEVFKTEHLKPMTPGRTLLLTELNEIARKNNTRITSGIDMRMQTPDQESAAEDVRKQKKSLEKLEIFPKVSVRFTIWGAYENLRSFINQLEHSKQFLIIDSIDLKTVEDGQGVAAPQGMSGAGVSLTINLTAYYQL